MGTTAEKAAGNRNRDKPNHPAETITAARQLWNEGHSASAIGRMLDMSKSAIIGIASRHPGFTRRGCARLDPEFIASVRAMWENWMTASMIAARTGRDKRAIYEMVYRYGWPKRAELYRRG